MVRGPDDPRYAVDQRLFRHEGLQPPVQRPSGVEDLREPEPDDPPAFQLPVQRPVEPHDRMAVRPPPTAAAVTAARTTSATPCATATTSGRAPSTGPSWARTAARSPSTDRSAIRTTRTIPTRGRTSSQPGPTGRRSTRRPASGTRRTTPNCVTCAIWRRRRRTACGAASPTPSRWPNTRS